MNFEERTSKHGLTFYFLELITSDLKTVVVEEGYKRFFEIDTESKIGFISEDTGNVVHFSEVEDGIIFRSLKDLIIYDNERCKNNLSEIAERAFIDDQNAIITYFEVCHGTINDYEESEKKRIFQDTKLILDRDNTLYFKNQLSLEKYKNRNNNDYPHSVFYGCNPYGENLLSNIDEVLQNQLVNTLGVSNLDFSKESLLLIDHQLAKIEWNDVLFYKTFLGLTIYLGECLIKNLDSFAWNLVLEKDQINYYPELILKEDAKSIPIVMYIYESFKSEYYIASNLRLLYDSIISSYG